MPTHHIADLSANVTPLRARMTERDYDAERTRLRDLYGDTNVEAHAKRDQALATLFARSGWTQEELAQKEGKERSYIARRLLFGRFLHFVPAGTNTELPRNLTEGRFRALWEQTPKAHKDEIRFRDVLKLIQSELIIADRRPAIGKQIKEQFADGKWHTVEHIAKSLELDKTHVADTLRTMMALRGTYGCRAERKSHSSKLTYRIFKHSNRPIAASELVEKLTPIVAGLRAEGKRSAAAASPAAVAILAGQLQKLIDEWTQ